MSLFRANEMVGDIKDKRAAAGKAGYAKSPHMQRLMEENGALKHSLRQTKARIDALEEFRDDQMEWNRSCQATVEDHGAMLAADGGNPYTCPGCGNQFCECVDHFPGMARSAVPEGIDYRLCRNCMPQAIAATDWHPNVKARAIARLFPLTFAEEGIVDGAL
jgi:hypothetical protein